MNSPVGLSLGGQRQALTMLMATMVTRQAAAARRAHRRPRPRHGGKVLDLTRHVVAERNITCLMVTHNMHPGAGSWQPHADDGRGQNRTRHLRRGARPL